MQLYVSDPILTDRTGRLECHFMIDSFYPLLSASHHHGKSEFIEYSVNILPRGTTKLTVLKKLRSASEEESLVESAAEQEETISSE